MGGNLSLFHDETWNPFIIFGLNNQFFNLNWETLFNTWGALGLILIFALVGRWAISKPNSVFGYLFLSIIRSFTTMVSQSVGKLSARYYYFIASLFIYLVVCNALVVIPGFEEPTKDLNTTFALALISFFYTQIEGLKAHGIIAYIQEYLKMPLPVIPKNGWTFFGVIFALIKSVINIVIAICSLPMELLSKSATIISLSLRLFGNIFGGSVITTMSKWFMAGSWIKQSLALMLGLNLIVALFFGLFEAFIQALVFSILSLTYITIATQHEDEGHEASREQSIT